MRVGLTVLGSILIATLPVNVSAEQSERSSQLEPLSIPRAAVIEFGEWPLEHADPDGVEAMLRHEIAWAMERFGDELEFACFGYSYGQPTPAFFERFADVPLRLEGRLNCSPYVGEEGMSVLLGLSTIRCTADNCTAFTDVSFGEVIEPGVPISARKVDGNWSVQVER